MLRRVIYLRACRDPGNCASSRSPERAISPAHPRPRASDAFCSSGWRSALSIPRQRVSTGTCCVTASAVPGRPGSRDSWGELRLVVDTSAWSRAHHERVRESFNHALRGDRLRVSPAARLEILLTARDARVFDELAEKLSTPCCTTTTTTTRSPRSWTSSPSGLPLPARCHRHRRPPLRGLRRPGARCQRVSNSVWSAKSTATRVVLAAVVSG